MDELNYIFGFISQYSAEDMRNSDEAVKFNERGELLYAKHQEIKNKMFVYEDVQ